MPRQRGQPRLGRNQFWGGHRNRIHRKGEIPGRIALRPDVAPVLRAERNDPNTSKSHHTAAPSGTASIDKAGPCLRARTKRLPFRPLWIRHGNGNGAIAPTGGLPSGATEETLNSKASCSSGGSLIVTAVGLAQPTAIRSDLASTRISQSARKPLGELDGVADNVPPTFHRQGSNGHRLGGHLAAPPAHCPPCFLPAKRFWVTFPFPKLSQLRAVICGRAAGDSQSQPSRSELDLLPVLLDLQPVGRGWHQDRAGNGAAATV